MKISTRLFAVFSAAAIAASAFGSISASAAPAADNTGMRDITTMELVRDMGLGINLGNTFESCGSWINDSAVKNYETAWGSPVITREMIQGYADSGFGVIRIPVAWSNMMGEDYTINPDYMARVKEVVDWTVDSGMYAIVNIHWDSGWWENFPSDETECMYKYERMWNQICDGFKDFDDHVMFESLNEEGGWSELWNRYDPGNIEGKKRSYDLLNKINQKFVDIVRSSGGNNAERHLLIAGYNTDIALTCDPLFKMPDDPEGRCAVSVHYYTPAVFCLIEKDESWGKARTEWGTAADYQELNSNMDMLKETFIDKGIPVIVGEYGCTTKNKTQENVRKFISAACEAMYTRGLCPVLWDITYSEDHSLSFYNRYTCQMSDPELEKAFAEIASGDIKKESKIDVQESYEVTYGDPAFNLNASADSGAALTYESSDPKIASVDNDGNVTPIKAGTVTISIYADGTDEYLPASAQTTVTVNKIPNPPTSPDKQMTVENSVTDTSMIKLPQGWSWVRKVELAEGEITVARAIYSDVNYNNRTVDVEIYRKSADETVSSQPSDESSSSSSSSSTGNTSSTSSASASSAASSSKPTASSDASPNTGVGTGIAGTAAILAAAVFAVRRKNK